MDRPRLPGVIFDLDGTLYDQRALRRRMAVELARYYAPRPWRWREVVILERFRRLREDLAEAGQADIARQQYRVPAQALSVAAAEVETLVEEWLQRRPLRHLPQCRFSLVVGLPGWLAQQGCRVAVLSDYPPHAKLRAIGWEGVAAWSSTDPAIDRLKPDPAGVRHICQQWGLPPSACVLIGDRAERDGTAARRAGAAALIVPHGLNFPSRAAFLAAWPQPL